MGPRHTHYRPRGSTEAFIPATPLSRRCPPELAQASPGYSGLKWGPAIEKIVPQLFRIRTKQPKEMEPCQS